MCDSAAGQQVTACFPSGTRGAGGEFQPGQNRQAASGGEGLSAAPLLSPRPRWKQEGKKQVAKQGEPRTRRNAGPAFCKPAELNAFGRGKQRALLRAEPPGWVNTLWKRWQQAISPNAAGTPRWLEIKQVFARTEPSPRPPAGLPSREGSGGISCCYPSLTKEAGKNLQQCLHIHKQQP